jgi:hypothetical protein
VNQKRKEKKEGFLQSYNHSNDRKKFCDEVAFFGFE